jgi:hypothetical protein
VLIEWAYAYFTYQRGTRLITGLQGRGKMEEGRGKREEGIGQLQGREGEWEC